MTVTMSMEDLTSIWTISNFFKVINASSGVIGTWASNCILEHGEGGWGSLRTWMMFNGHTRSIRTWLDVGNRYSVVLLSVYLDAASVYDTLNTGLGKSWSFGLYHGIDGSRGPCMARLSVLSTFGGT